MGTAPEFSAVSGMEWTPTPTPVTPTPFARAPSAARLVAQPGPVFVPGAVIGPYLVIRSIGSGKVAEIYEVEHVDLGRRYSLKILSEESRPDGLERRRFDREAKVLAAIDHPNVLRIQHLDRLLDGRRYLVTELLRGRTLAERIRNGRLPVADACRIAEQIAYGLSAAHEKGVLHRDLKPSNIFLTDTEAGALVKLMDFGLARIEVPAADELTIGSEPVGTPGYMAPEQIARPSAVDVRADLYAVGAILFEMLTGAPLYSAEDEAGLLAANLAARVRDPRELRPDIPPAIAQLTLACLARDPILRPTSARVLWKVLRGLRKRRVSSPRTVQISLRLWILLLVLPFAASIATALLLR